MSYLYNKFHRLCQTGKLWALIVWSMHLSNNFVCNFLYAIKPIGIFRIKTVQLGCCAITIDFVKRLFECKVIARSQLMDSAVGLQHQELLSDANYSNHCSHIGLPASEVPNKPVDNVSSHDQLKRGDHLVESAIKPSMQQVVPVAEFNATAKVCLGHGCSHLIFFPIFWLGRVLVRFGAPGSSPRPMVTCRWAGYWVDLADLVLVAFFHLRFSWSFSCNWLKLKLLRAQLQFKHEKGRPNKEINIPVSDLLEVLR